MRIFIDTEFTNFIDTDLISIGMVASSGEEFYAEVPYPDAACSAFVREAVIPLLGDPDAFCPKPDLIKRIYSWLAVVRPDANTDIVICYDYTTDWVLFSDALGDHVPVWIKHENVNSNINEFLLWDFQKKDNYLEHHALHDARANRYAYRPR